MFKVGELGRLDSQRRFLEKNLRKADDSRELGGVEEESPSSFKKLTWGVQERCVV